MSGRTISTTISCEYDGLHRLTKATYNSGATFDYTYDATGNRLSQINAFGTITSTYDIANRLISVGTTPYQWDANGNLLDDGASTYAYDAANRLTNVTQGTTNYAFTYR